MRQPTSYAAVWHVSTGFPGAEESSKGQHASALRSLAHKVTDSGHDYDPGRVRPMTAEELSRTPTSPSPGVELRGLIYPLTGQPKTGLTLENLLIQETR